MKKLTVMLACLLMLALCCSALAEAELKLGLNSISVKKGKTTTVMFTAPSTAKYAFYSESSADTFARLYNASK